MTIRRVGYGDEFSRTCSPYKVGTYCRAVLYVYSVRDNRVLYIYEAGYCMG